MKINCFLILLLFVICSCEQNLPDEELTMTKIPYRGKDIRLDGYYTCNGEQNTTSVMFFYNNGILLHFSYSNQIDNILQNTYYLDKIRNNKSCWALFQVKNDSIYIQGWNLKSDVRQYIIFNHRFKIVDDTTINNFGNSSNSSFIHLSQKPDSTNVFIK